MEADSEDKDQSTSAYTTPSHHQDPNAGDCLSITSNIRNLVKDSDYDEGNGSNLMEVDRDAKRIKKRGHFDNDHK